MRLIKIYIVTLLIFMAIDSVWLGFISPDIYKKYIGHLMADAPRFDAAILFYLIYIAGLCVFSIMPAMNDRKWSISLARAVFFGVVTYATFDLTCQAVMRDWPWLISLIDLAWGGFLCGVTTLISGRLFRKKHSGD